MIKRISPGTPPKMNSDTRFGGFCDSCGAVYQFGFDDAVEVKGASKKVGRWATMPCPEVFAGGVKCKGSLKANELTTSCDEGKTT